MGGGGGGGFDIAPWLVNLPLMVHVSLHQIKSH